MGSQIDEEDIKREIMANMEATQHSSNWANEHKDSHWEDYEGHVELEKQMEALGRDSCYLNEDFGSP